MRLLLLRLLERRFGALPGWARDRLAIADSVTLAQRFVLRGQHLYSN